MTFESGNTKQVLVEAFIESLNALIGHYAGVDVEFAEVEHSMVKSACASSVGFSDENFKGVATLFVSDPRLAEKMDACQADSSSDWMGEMGNQLVGRFKNKVAAYGLLINMGLPSVICGRDLHHGSENRAGCWHLSWKGIEISGLLSLDINNDLYLEPVEEHSVAEEGSLCFF